MVVSASSSALLGQGQRPAQAAPAPLRIRCFQGLHRHCPTPLTVISPLYARKASKVGRWVVCLAHPLYILSTSILNYWSVRLPTFTAEHQSAARSEASIVSPLVVCRDWLRSLGLLGETRSVWQLQTKITAPKPGKRILPSYKLRQGDQYHNKWFER